MGFFDDSVIGFDFNCDGKVDMLDDVLFMEHMEEEEKRSRDAFRNDLDDDDWDDD